MTVVVVESPAKAKTINKYLGKDFIVLASYGHVRDLPAKDGSVRPDADFEMDWEVDGKSAKRLSDIAAALKTDDRLILATDPDREGEAIAWHLMEAAEIDPQISKRVVFHEITQPAIKEAFSNPRQIDMSLVDAQQARRVLDRLVGYSLSPLLWEKVRSRLSAGRVQSVALRLIVEREREIELFNPVEYWTLCAELKPKGSKKSNYQARLVRLDDADPNLSDQKTVDDLVLDLDNASYEISKIKRTERKRKPQAPFITSSLQQEASRRLGYTARRTMALAQQLYEGLEGGEGGTTGLITYMRTDSTNVSELAQHEARDFILHQYGKDFLPSTPPFYKTRAVGAQEAHEAIRPTSVMRSPEKVKSFLTSEQFKLYQLIWQRFVASQMESAVFDAISVDISTVTPKHNYLWRATGSTLRFSGYLIVYVDTKDEDLKTEEDEDVRIPAGLEEGQRQELVRLIPEQHFTQPPPRFTEASLVQSLEEYGIGRPSTYAPILSTIQERGYVLRENKRLIPTETGILVNDLLVNHFPGVVDLRFTATMESYLDQVAEGDREWHSVIGDFYRSFEPQLKKAQAEMPVTKTELEKIGRICPDCGNELVIRYGRFGKFISCSNFPACRHTEPWLEKIGVACPKDGGEIVMRKTRKGRIFFGCANYPTCDFTSWKKPVPQPCPNCGGLMVVSNRREVQCTQCQKTYVAEQTEETSIETA